MQAARLPLQRKICDRGSHLVRPRMVEREQKGSAARSTQQMSARRVAPCRVTTMPARWAKTQRARTLQGKDRRRKTWRHRAPNFSFGRKQLRVEFCSIVAARAPAFALPVWNGTGTAWHRHPADEGIRAGSPGHRPPRQRARNDSRSRTRNRSRSQPMRSERWLSRQP